MPYRISVDSEGDTLSEADAGRLVQAVTAALELTAQSDGAGVTVTLVDDAAIQLLNATYREIDAPTDVLSFSALEGDGFVLPEGLPVELGDVIISGETAARQAEAMGHPVESELALLAIHGTLHLCGRDHDTSEEQAEMWRLQDEVLQRLGYTLRSYTPPDQDQDHD